ncbi:MULTISPECIES: GFA family protein [Rhizobium/Agrobacterium group]|uniref:GFA family protein n=2 Tax=Rhizobium/Agrobacterium group TaxID=227290 RepID=UPI0026A6DEB5
MGRNFSHAAPSRDVFLVAVYLGAAHRELDRRLEGQFALSRNGSRRSQVMGNDGMKQVAKCSCGKLSAVATGEPRKVSACHCKSCQRRTGSPFGVAVFFERSEVVIAGESRTYVRSGDSGMNLTFHFCSDCGSSVYWLPEFRPGLVAVALGASRMQSGSNWTRASTTSLLIPG